MITTQKSFTDRKQFDKHMAMYESIGYKHKTGKRVPNGTKHKLLLIYNCFFIYEMYHL